VGTGFHPELTGRENVYLNGAILGMTRREVRSKFDEIVSFADIDEFIDTPVKRYSSGMYVRLAFAVAAHLDPEILVIDEVLAVGDVDFQKKCLGKMDEVAGQFGRTVLFVSHQMGVVSALCRQAVIFEQGRVSLRGTTSKVVADYLKSGIDESGELCWPDSIAPGSEKVRLTAVRTVSDGIPTSNIPLSRPAYLELEFENKRPGLKINASFHLLDKLGNCIFATANLPSASLGNDPSGGQPHSSGRYRVSCEIPANFLNEETYRVSAFVVSNHQHIEAEAIECLSFRVHDDGHMRQEYTGVWIGAIRPRLHWRTEKLV
jgi:lipopolysaccharide transport system ATP-binding protein